MTSRSQSNRWPCVIDLGSRVSLIYRVIRTLRAWVALRGRSLVATHIDACFARHRRLPITIRDVVLRGIDRVNL